MSLTIALIGLLTGLAALIMKLLPSPQDKQRRQDEVILESEKKFKKEHDTTDLGDLG